MITSEEILSRVETWAINRARAWHPHFSLIVWLSHTLVQLSEAQWIDGKTRDRATVCMQRKLSFICTLRSFQPEPHAFIIIPNYFPNPITNNLSSISGILPTELSAARVFVKFPPSFITAISLPSCHPLKVNTDSEAMTAKAPANLSKRVKKPWSGSLPCQLTWLSSISGNSSGLIAILLLFLLLCYQSLEL